MAFLLLACEKQGPLERAGEEIDEAVEDIKAGGETTGNKIDDAIDEARKNVEDAAEEADPN
jgi:vacuolar-type H+-ATPase subunit H